MIWARCGSWSSAWICFCKAGYSPLDYPGITLGDFMNQTRRNNWSDTFPVSLFARNTDELFCLSVGWREAWQRHNSAWVECILEAQHRSLSAVITSAGSFQLALMSSMAPGSSASSARAVARSSYSGESLFQIRATSARLVSIQKHIPCRSLRRCLRWQ